jgi:hypothetical protein
VDDDGPSALDDDDDLEGLLADAGAGAAAGGSQQESGEAKEKKSVRITAKDGASSPGGSQVICWATQRQPLLAAACMPTRLGWQQLPHTLHGWPKDYGIHAPWHMYCIPLWCSRRQGAAQWQRSRPRPHQGRSSSRRQQACCSGNHQQETLHAKPAHAEDDEQVAERCGQGGRTWERRRVL